MRPSIPRCFKRESGQAGTEYMLVVSVIVIAVVAASYAFVPRFRSGVLRVASDVSEMLDTGTIGDAGTSRSADGSTNAARGIQARPHPHP